MKKIQIIEQKTNIMTNYIDLFNDIIYSCGLTKLNNKTMIND